MTQEALNRALELQHVIAELQDGLEMMDHVKIHGMKLHWGFREWNKICLLPESLLPELRRTYQKSLDAYVKELLEL